MGFTASCPSPSRLSGSSHRTWGYLSSAPAGAAVPPFIGLFFGMNLSFVHSPTGATTFHVVVTNVSELLSALLRLQYAPFTTFLPTASAAAVGMFWVVPGVVVPIERLPSLIHGLHDGSLAIEFIGRDCPSCEFCDQEDDHLPAVICTHCNTLHAMHHHRCCERAGPVLRVPVWRFPQVVTTEDDLVRPPARRLTPPGLQHRLYGLTHPDNDDSEIRQITRHRLEELIEDYAARQNR